MKESVISLFSSEVRKQPLMLCASVISAIIVQLIALSQPVVFKQFIDILAGKGELSSLSNLVVMLVIIYVSAFVVQRFVMFFLVELEAKIKRDLHIRAFESILHKSEEFFVNQFTGALTRKIGRLTGTFEQAYDAIIQSFIPSIIVLAGSVVVLWFSHPYLALALFVWILIFVSTQLYLHKKQRPLRATRVIADTALHAQTADAMSNRSSVVLFSAFSYEVQRVRDRAFEWYRANIAVWRFTESSWIVLGGLQVIIQVVMLLLGVHLWQQGLISVGDFVLIFSYFILIADRLGGLHNSIKRFIEAMSDAQDTISVMNTPLLVVDSANAKRLEVTDGALSLSHVSFSYKKDMPLLQDFTLHLGAREKVALVGTSGAGKSTITKLLLRLYDVTDGAITIDGVDIRAVTQESLRNAIAFVPQEPLLFHRTLRENIRYGRSGATDEEVEEAARKAFCHEFILKTPNGYDTLVGERGVKLSGGERQRVAIARAILKNAPLLILDEATASLDSESEHLIQEALVELMKDKTVIAIAHRLSTIMHMDRIVVVENGAVALTGTHRELMDHEGNIYKKLFSLQSGGFITE
jgi:ATP-binding cassette subfamily B protein